MKIHDIGTLTGPVLAFGGPYSNFQATRALIDLADARGIPASNCICTGDVVAYCANPAETVALIRTFGCPVVAGNCEVQLAAGAGDCGCGFEAGSACEGLSSAWYAHADRHISADVRAWMAALPDLITFTHEAKRYAVIHGGTRDVARFIWPSSDLNLFRDEFQRLEALTGAVDVVIAGHSGVAFVRNVDTRLWVNAGAIGMPPHDARPLTRYVMLGDGAPRIERLVYDHKAAAQAMSEAQLCQGYDQALISGIWPSEEVLPPDLRRAT